MYQIRVDVLLRDGANYFSRARQIHEVESKVSTDTCLNSLSGKFTVHCQSIFFKILSHYQTTR